VVAWRKGERAGVNQSSVSENKQSSAAAWRASPLICARTRSSRRAFMAAASRAGRMLALCAWRRAMTAAHLHCLCRRLITGARHQTGGINIARQRLSTGM